ncbi:MAG: DUF6464 family protein [Cyanobacteriota bacterium]
MRIELRQIDTDRLIDTLTVEGLGEVPHPGRWLVHDGASYLVMQRRHCYRLRAGRYELASVALQVKSQARPADARPWNGGWVIGDPSCRFNARSPLLRCAVLPDGPCQSCAHYSC